MCKTILDKGLTICVTPIPEHKCNVGWNICHLFFFSFFFSFEFVARSQNCTQQVATLGALFHSSVTLWMLMIKTLWLQYRAYCVILIVCFI